MIRSRRLALVAIVLAFGISACGDPSTTTPLAQQSKPKVIKLATSGQRATAEVAPAAAAPSGGAADSKIAFMAPTEFVYDGDLPALDGSAASWYFAPGTKPDVDRIAKLAASFGVTGDVRTLPADQGGGWAVGPEDYSGPVLAVGSDGMLSWWLNGTPSAVSAGCAVGGSTAPNAGSGVAGAVPADTGTVPPDALPPVSTPAADIPCAVPQPPEGVPTKEEALAKAKELFASWGYDVNSYQFETPYADEWSASVSASLILAGMKAPITLSVGFGANGAVTYASGSLAAPQQGADYPTVGAAAGLERLKTQQNQYVGMSDTGIMKGAATDQVAPPQTAVAGTAVATPGVATPAPDIATPAPDIAPVCTTDMNVDCGQVNREPVKVTLNSVKRDLTMVWDADGTIWLLPAYTFGSADGGIYTVIAVTDAYIQQPEATVDTAPVGTAEPGVEISTPVATSDCRVNTDPTTLPNAPLKQIAEAVVGYCVTDAQKLAESYGYTVRVARQDGVDLQVTADYSESRINVAVEKGTVTEVLSIG